jgi:uncharacterized protein DUF5947
MAGVVGGAADGPLGVLQRIRQPPALPRPGERCELCAEPIPDDHSHVVDLQDRGLLCACRPCALLFTHSGAAGGRYKTVGDRYLSVTDFSLSPGQWDSLEIPVAMAFFFRNSVSGEMAAFYPSPAGATESLLPLDAWREIEAANPVVVDLSEDVEAVLVRVEGAGFECFVVPIDACYELVGNLRRLWRGFDGGREAHEWVDAFFGGVRARAKPVQRG